MSAPNLASSRALWNRRALDLDSEETLAQFLDRGELWAWRELFARAQTDTVLRARIAQVVRRVPLAYGHFWLAALRTLGERVDFDTPLPEEISGP